jgi:hypothetical protein
VVVLLPASANCKAVGGITGGDALTNRRLGDPSSLREAGPRRRVSKDALDRTNDDA